MKKKKKDNDDLVNNNIVEVEEEPQDDSVCVKETSDSDTLPVASTSRIRDVCHADSAELDSEEIVESET